MATSSAAPGITAAIGTTLVARASEVHILETPVLGSCVALVAHHAALGVGGLTSFLRADAGRAAAGLDELREALTQAGAEPDACAYHVVGGADPLNLPADHPLALGAANLSAARAAIAARGLAVATDLGGGCGPWRVALRLRDGAVANAARPRQESVPS